MSKKPSNLPGKVLIYTTLIVWSVVTLVPFLYMATSSVKPKSVFFSAPFLPDTPLFTLDPATAELAVGDVTRLPPASEPRVYELEISTAFAGEETARQTATVGWQTTDADFVVPDDADVNTSLGRIDFAGPTVEKPEAADVSGGDNSQGADDAAAMAESEDAVVPAEVVAGSDESRGTPTYAIVGGNDSGFGGVAWGLLTDDNFDRLVNGIPQDDDGDGTTDRRISTGVARALVNSFYYASVTAVLATLGAAMGGYALSKFRFRGRSLIDNTVLAALVIPGALLIAPGYQLLYWLGLLDSYLGLILPGLAPAFGVYLFRQAMIGGVPDEMIEAARIDGCGEIRLFFDMALPMVRPMVGAFLLITYLGAWNNFIGPQIVLQTPEKFPLAVWISQLRGVYGIDYGLIMAGTLVAIAPVLVLFLLLQREFIAGLTAGAVKG